MKNLFITFYLLFCLILLNNLSFSQSVSLSKAKQIAQNHLLTIGKNYLKSATLRKEKIQFNTAKTAVENSDTLYYILNDSINNSFVIVSADERTWPILGYSTQGIYDEKKQSEAFVAWMDARKKEIEYIIVNNLQADKQTVAEWNQLETGNNTLQSNSVEPLLKTKWDQGCFYNETCPAFENAYCGGHAPTGCVATAMAQIMKYWNFPTKGIGSHSYLRPDSPYGEISGDFGSTTYQWAQMPNIVTEKNDAVATLMFHCGVAVDMWYTSFSSGANEPSKALVDYFDYSANIEYIDRFDYSKEEFVTLLKDELNQGHPIYYETYTGLAHGFICDGYQDNDYFHFNWGWGGNSDGYYYIGNMNKLNEDNNNNTLSDRAIIKIFPNKIPDGYNGIFLSANKLNLDAKEGVKTGIPVKIASSANWTATCDESWLTLSSGSGKSGTSVLTLTVTENHNQNPRKAIVRILAEGFSEQLIMVNQLQVLEVEAGGLHNLILNDLATITNLTLDGTMDARDFRTLRDEMPKLAKLDLSGVQVVEYTGIDGTAVENTDAGVKPSKNVTAYPEDVLPIGAFRFFYISQDLKPRLKSVILPSSITTIGQEAFYNCRGLVSVVISSSVVKIEYSAFYNCRQLATIDFPSSLTSIDYNAFNFCEHLFPGTIPSTIKSIGTGAFAGVKGQIIVDPQNLNYSSLEGVLYNKDKTRLMQCPTSIVGSFTIPSTVKTIEFIAFSRDYQLTSITIPQSVVSIEPAAFSNCFGLKKISLHASIKSIGSFAFENCYNVDTIISKSKIPIDLANTSGVFNNLKKDLVILKVPFGSKSAYQAADQWKDFENILEMPNQTPIANAGADQTVDEGSIVYLDGSPSNDPEGHTLTYNWTAPDGISLSSTSTSKPIFTAPEVLTDQTYNFSLVVSDGIASSQRDEITVKVKQGNKAPVANAGVDQSVFEGSTVTLDGTLSIDPEGQTISFYWVAPVGITLSSSDSSKPTFIATETTTDKTYKFSLIVSDGVVNSTADQVEITVKHRNQAPTAKAGEDQIVNEGSIVTLDGSLSDDREGNILTYNWIYPDGINLSNSNSSNPTFLAPMVNSDSKITFFLIVQDGNLNSLIDQVDITVKDVINVGIDQFESPEFRIFPNPTSGITKIEFPEMKNQSKHVSIYNMQGEEIFSKNSFADNYLVDLTPFKNGFYLLKITTESKNYTAKIILER